jgi:hypothetical protein
MPSVRGNGEDGVADPPAHEHDATTGVADACDRVARARRERALVLGGERGEIVTRRTDDAEPFTVDRVERELAVHRAIGQLGDAHAGLGAASRRQPVDPLDAAQRGVHVEHDARESGCAHDRASTAKTPLLPPVHRARNQRSKARGVPAAGRRTGIVAQ